MEIWQVASILAYTPPPPAGTSYAAGGVDPNAIRRAKAGEAVQIGRVVVPPRGDKSGGTSPLAGARPAVYVPPEDRDLTDAPVST